MFYINYTCRKVREIYLDGLIEIQTSSGDGNASESAYGLIQGVNTQSESEADISFETDTGTGDEQVKIDEYCGAGMIYFVHVVVVCSHVTALVRVNVSMYPRIYIYIYDVCMHVCKYVFMHI